MSTRTAVIWSGLAGLAAAIIVGTGEFLLHFDELARYGSGFDFFKGVNEERATTGHFIGAVSYTHLTLPTTPYV